MEVRKDLLGKGITNNFFEEAPTVKTIMPTIWDDLVWHGDVIHQGDSSGPGMSLVGDDEGFSSLLPNFGTGGQCNTTAPAKFMISQKRLILLTHDFLRALTSPSVT